MKILTQKYINTFWAHVEILGENDCWEWKACKHKSGYGIATGIHKRCEYAHRVSWEITNGEIPYKMEVCHKCDNPSCVNPSHLFLGTHKENMNDRDAKGRNRRWVGIKASYEVIKEIRTTHSKGGFTNREIARMFGFSQPYISRIVNNKQRVGD